MKRLAFISILALVSVCLIGCGEKAPPNQNLFAAAPVYDGSSTIVTEEVKIAPFENKLEIIGKSGEAQPYHTEMICFSDGKLTGDGALMFYSVPNYLPQIAEKIPSVDLGDTPEIRATARKGVEVSGGETVSVYGEDFALLTENISLSEACTRGKTEWAGKTVYLYFTVTFSQTEVPDYVSRSTIGYFVKTVFAQ